MRDEKASRRERYERRRGGQQSRRLDATRRPVDFDWDRFRASLPTISGPAGLDRALVEKRKAARRARHEVVMGLAQRREGVTVDEVAAALGSPRSVAYRRLRHLQGQGILEVRRDGAWRTWHDTGHRPGHAHRRGQPIGGSGGIARTHGRAA